MEYADARGTYARLGRHRLSTALTVLIVGGLRCVPCMWPSVRTALTWHALTCHGAVEHQWTPNREANSREPELFKFDDLYLLCRVLAWCTRARMSCSKNGLLAWGLLELA